MSEPWQRGARFRFWTGALLVTALVGEPFHTLASGYFYVLCSHVEELKADTTKKVVPEDRLFSECFVLLS